MTMPVFQFMLDGATEAQVRIAGLTSTSNEILDELKTTVDPIRQGGWVGQGATAFLQKMDELLAESQAMAMALNEFQLAMAQVIDDTTTMMHSIETMMAADFIHAVSGAVGGSD